MTACLLKNEPASCSASHQVKGVVARSRSESESEEGVEWRGADPKPRELPMARVKVRLCGLEARTHRWFKIEG